ncbi:tetratricopeptide repeat protein [Candidatus Viadribacter manganicus]|uniref:Sel1 repeat family protein n=1 Tax=Candidatus Viadribacter manganicus TaxID=1759059 RepID=A0A1B1AK72_9PROT|nr:tetratricopeptide repeat protein [Candidatus Viadribacter manganicus]ANP46964.1 hypothetical protein ATE48_14090 [Candidatus Viadribacter manganicus]
MRAIALVLAMFCAMGAPAFAQDVRDLAEARAAFERFDYSEAYARYTSLVSSPAGPEALYHLSIIYEGGYGVVPTDEAMALEMLQSAADAEYPAALTRLGMRHYEGNGFPQSHQEGLRLWRRASELGEVGATYSIGMYYLYIHGAERDVAEGARWMRRAADAGHADAQFDLAGLYERGEGVDANAGEAFALMRLAALQGHRSARVSMVQYYFDGTGVARDFVRAEMWALLVERDGEPVAPRGRAVLHAQMTAAQQSEAARLADQCAASSERC